MRRRRVLPVGVTLGLLAVDVAVAVYLFVKNNF